jgi:hypothetical protein
MHRGWKKVKKVFSLDDGKATVPSEAGQARYTYDGNFFMHEGTECHSTG